MSKRATKEEHIARIAKVKNMILTGSNFQEILEYAEQNYNVKKTATSKYIRHARKQLKQEAELFGYGLEYHLAARVNVYQKALEKEDFKNALKALDGMARLTGLIGKAATRDNENKETKNEEIFYDAIREHLPEGMRVRVES